MGQKSRIEIGILDVILDVMHDPWPSLAVMARTLAPVSLLAQPDFGYGCNLPTSQPT